MSIAKKCDRCKEFYELYNVEEQCRKPNSMCLLGINAQDKSYTHSRIDLCEFCMGHLKDWLSGDDTV